MWRPLSRSRRVAVTMAVRLAPPDGLPTAADTADEAAWTDLASTQLDSIRKTAESWRNGLAGILATLAGFTLIKGPSELSGLDHPADYVVGGLLLLALAVALFGAWMSLTAAYGNPAAISREEFRRQGGIIGYRLTLASRSMCKLRAARVATIFTVILVAAAIALTWYGPRSDSPVVTAERSAQAAICGRFIASDNGNIDIKPADAAPLRLRLADVTKLTVAAKCP
jgi:hypothetical protein